MNKNISLIGLWLLEILVTVAFGAALVWVLVFAINSASDMVDSNCKESCEAVNAEFITRTFDGCFCERNGERFKIE